MFTIYFPFPLLDFMEATMKKYLVICAAALTVCATAAYAGVDLSWDGCPPNAAATGNKVFVCDGSGFYQLWANYQPSVPIANFIGIQGQVDIQSAVGPISPFWAFELGGCNETSFAPTDARGVTAPTCNIPTQFGTTGAAGTDVFQYTRSGAPNRALYQFADARTTSVATIAAGSNQYAFTLNIDELNAPGAGGADCAGCGDNVAFVLNEIDVASTTNPIQPETGPGLRGNCGTANGASAGTCAATPTQNKSWGSVKALYR
jgi:hypothetical protein